MPPLSPVKPVNLWPISYWCLAFISPSPTQGLLWQYPTSVLPGNDYSRLSGFRPRTWLWPLSLSLWLPRPSQASQPSQYSFWLLASISSGLIWPSYSRPGDRPSQATHLNFPLCLSGYSQINILQQWPKALTACITPLISQVSQYSLGLVILPLLLSPLVKL